MTPSHQTDSTHSVGNFLFEEKPSKYSIIDWVYKRIVFDSLFDYSQQPNVMNVSSESLPPPPAYLLDSAERTPPGKASETHVTQTVKGKQGFKMNINRIAFHHAQRK